MGDKSINAAVTAFDSLEAASTAGQDAEGVYSSIDPAGIVQQIRSIKERNHDSIDRLVKRIDAAVAEDSYDEASVAALTKYRDTLLAHKSGYPADPTE